MLDKDIKINFVYEYSLEKTILENISILAKLVSTLTTIDYKEILSSLSTNKNLIYINNNKLSSILDIHISNKYLINLRLNYYNKNSLIGSRDYFDKLVLKYSSTKLKIIQININVFDQKTELYNYVQENINENTIYYLNTTQCLYNYNKNIIGKNKMVFWGALIKNRNKDIETEIASNILNSQEIEILKNNLNTFYNQIIESPSKN